jgi:hypothetical protein
VGNFVVWVVWVVAVFACLGSGAAVGGVVLGSEVKRTEELEA